MCYSEIPLEQLENETHHTVQHRQHWVNLKTDWFQYSWKYMTTGHKQAFWNVTKTELQTDKIGRLD